MAQYPPIPELLDPYQVKPQDSHDRKFIEYIYTQQKTSVSNNEALFQKVINGMGDAAAWAENQKSGNPERIFKKFLEQYTAEKDYQPAMILYPRILKVFGPDQIDMQINMIMSFERGFLSAPQQINALRDLNFSSIVECFKKRTQALRKITVEYEDSPGSIITGGDYSRVPNYAKLSAEQSLIDHANSVMRGHGLPAQAFSLFRKDVTYIISDEQKLVKRICDGLHLPASEGGLIPHEEVVYCYRVLADAFEQFVRGWAKKQKKLMPFLKRFDEEFPAQPNRRQKKDRIGALIDLFEKIIERGDPNDMLNRLSALMKAISVLMIELDREYDKIAETQIIKRTREIKEGILNAAKKKYDCLEVHPDAVFSETVFNDSEYTRKHSNAVMRRLMDNSDLCYATMPGQENQSVYFTYLPLLFRIEAESIHRGDQEKTAVVGRIIEQLNSTRPNITSYRRLLKEYDEKLHIEAVRLMQNLQRQAQTKKMEQMEEKKSLNRMICASAGFVGVVIANGLYAAFAEYSPVYAVIISVPVFLGLYGLGAVVLNTLKKSEGRAGKAATGRTGPRDAPSPLDAPEDNANVLSDLDYFFPRDVTDEMAKVYTPKKFLNKIKELERISNIHDDETRREAIRELQKPLMRHIVTIKIPENRLPPNYSSFILMGRIDFKNADFRKKVAQHFKTEAERHSQHGQFNEKAVDYYLYIANEIEFNHARYLK